MFILAQPGDKIKNRNTFLLLHYKKFSKARKIQTNTAINNIRSMKGK